MNNKANTNKGIKFDFKFVKNVSFAVLKSKQIYKVSPTKSNGANRFVAGGTFKKNAKKHHATSKAKIALSSFDKNFCIYAPYALSTPPQIV